MFIFFGSEIKLYENIKLKEMRLQMKKGKQIPSENLFQGTQLHCKIKIDR